jgi:MYXO-CTERM domain-containing protein
MKAVAVAIALSVLVGTAQADSITFAMANPFSGPGTPSGVPTVTIDDGGGTGSVTFTFDMTNLGPSDEFISQWFFNTAIDLSATGSFSAFTNIVGTTTDPTAGVQRTFDTTLAAFKADGDGFYDWVFDFPTAGNDAGRFEDGDKFSFVYTAGGITAQTFNVLGLDGPGSTAGPFKSAIHLQGTTTGSVWLSEGTPDTGTIPEPSLALLALLGIAGVLARRRS